MKVENGGFTLVELLVTLSIVCIIAGSLVKMFSTMAIGHTTRTTTADLQQSVRSVLDLIGRELRMAGFSSLSPGKFGIINADGGEITFSVDWDNDGYLTESHASNKLIREESDIISYHYRPDHLDVVRVTGVDTASESTQSILGGKGDPMRVVGLEFYYFDRRGSSTNRISDISSVGVALTADLPAGIKGRKKRIYQTRINCRNLQL